jgi:ribosomal protein S18 acetylase RimI-like enzyme
MTSIVKATIKDSNLLSKIGKQSFLESHGISAPEKDIMDYVSSKFTKEVFEKELEDSNNIFHMVFYNEKPIGYSKIIYNVSQENMPIKNVTKLERLYVLKEFHHLKLGLELFNFNVELSKKNNQAGMWLFVWTENLKAINFYKKAGFNIVGKYNFKISETHSNPNHQMLLLY